jgi:hypothetical protein
MRTRSIIMYPYNDAEPINDHTSRSALILVTTLFGRNTLISHILDQPSKLEK